MSDHAIVHVDISANDLRAASKFYSETFGWKTEFFEAFNYTTFAPGSGPGGGFTKVDGETFNAGDVLVYIDSDDIEATLAKIEAAGGKTLLPKTEIPGIGWFAYFSDPTGNRLGLYTGGGETG